MIPWVLTSYATPRYEQYVKPWKEQARGFAPAYFVDRPREFLDPKDDMPSWYAATAWKPTFLLAAMDKHPGKAIVWLDIDGLLMRRPVLFDTVEGPDLMVYQRPRGEVLSGTVWIAPTPGARKLVEAWAENVKIHRHLVEQDSLRAAIAEHPEVNVAFLPVEYCWVPDWAEKDHPAVPREHATIVHQQASRVFRGGKP